MSYENAWRGGAAAVVATALWAVYALIFETAFETQYSDGPQGRGYNGDPASPAGASLPPAPSPL